ncbi:MAG: nuclear transport factor 2 family protein, partial [Ignavibacteriaceae bacterium]|nr:nuclear transport factor 2 family protein [Ignavibacteriaceae bacterium]
MKSLKLLVAVFVLILSHSLFAEDKSDIEQTITTYVNSVDTRNADALSKTVLSNASIITINEITKNLDNYSTAQFVNLVKGGQKGGWQRNVNIGDVDINGNTAVAKVDITDSKLKESGFVTLVKDN